MKISGIVCEYNPFHNGHLYHIKQTRDAGATHIIAVMSGNFVQRGDVAILNKFERAKSAILGGVDLVIELPVPYSLATAEIFARGAIYILNALGCVDELSFGSECGHMGTLYRAVHASIECSKNPDLRTLMENGSSYPAALQELISKTYDSATAEIFNGPNNLLAIEYIKAIIYLNSKIKPFTIMRKNAPHDSTAISPGFSSASYIRSCIEDGTDYTEFMPGSILSIYETALREKRLAHINNLERVILYKLRTVQAEELKNVPDVGQGLENRFIAESGALSLRELMMAVKTKRYPLSRIRRIILNMLLGITKADLSLPPPYARILAINERGSDILNEVKSKSGLHVSTSLAKLADTGDAAKRFANIESRSSDIYALASCNILPSKTDYTAKIIITE